MPVNTQRFLEEKNIFPMLLQLALPAIVAGLIDSLYNTVDSIFVGQFVGKTALAALSVINVIQLTYISIGVLFSVGNSSIISRALGAKNFDYAVNILKHSFWGTFVISNIISITILLNLENFLRMIGANNEVLPHAKAYGSIILWTGFILPINNMMLGALRAQGKVLVGTKLSITAALMNITLDAIFIIVFKMGVAGAALATAISQIFLFINLTLKIKELYHTNLLFYKLSDLKFREIGKIVTIGFPTGFRLILFVVVYSFANSIAGSYGSEYLSAFGIYTRLVNLMAMICICLTMGAQPLIGINYGAQLFDRVRKIILTALSLSFAVSLTISLVLIISPSWLYKIFIDDPAVIAICKEIASTEGLTFWGWGIFICIVEALQAMGHAKQSISLSLVYPLIVLLCLFILPSLIGVSGIWVGFAITYIIIAIFAALMLFYDLKKLRHKELALKNAY